MQPRLARLVMARVDRLVADMRAIAAEPRDLLSQSGPGPARKVTTPAETCFRPEDTRTARHTSQTVGEVSQSARDDDHRVPARQRDRQRTGGRVVTPPLARLLPSGKAMTANLLTRTGGMVA